MPKKKNWLDRLKKFLSSESQSKQEKKERRRRWIFGKLKSKFPPALPPPSLQRLRSLREAEQEQSKHAVAVAVATAAAAEAAVAAAYAAARVVRLTGNHLPYQKTQEISAIKIQTAFRRYLARRALKALRGLVKLQALIRGQAVRRRTSITLKGLQSLMKIQSQARANRMRVSAKSLSHEGDAIHVKTKQDSEAKNSVVQHNEKRWDSSILSKEEIIALLRKRQEAAFKRERAMDYASTHQEGTRNAIKLTSPTAHHDLESGDPRTKMAWLESWVGVQPLHKDIHEVSPAPRRDQIAPNQQFHPSESPNADDIELMYQARRSFNRSERARSKDDESSSSSCFPSYMASTASTKAKFRSASTPKQRRMLDCSDHCSINKDHLFLPSPSAKNPQNHPRTPRLRGGSGGGKNLSMDSERCLLNWEKCSPVR